MYKVAYTIAKHVNYIHMHQAHIASFTGISDNKSLQLSTGCGMEQLTELNDIGSGRVGKTFQL